jgi:CheY-like chemotaxis protein
VRILIAEDELVVRQILERMLVEWGYEVVMSSDGAEAYRILKAYPYRWRMAPPI